MLHLTTTSEASTSILPSPIHYILRLRSCALQITIGKAVAKLWEIDSQIFAAEDSTAPLSAKRLGYRQYFESQPRGPKSSLSPTPTLTSEDSSPLTSAVASKPEHLAPLSPKKQQDIRDAISSSLPQTTKKRLYKARSPLNRTTITTHHMISRSRSRNLGKSDFLALDWSGRLPNRRCRKHQKDAPRSFGSMFAKYTTQPELHTKP